MSNRIGGQAEPDDASHRAGLALNKLCKWRMILVGRILGTQPASPQVKGYQDIFEKLIIQRAEMDAIVDVLIRKRVLTRAEITVAIEKSARELDEAYAKAFKGARSTPDGMEIYDPIAWLETTTGWPK